MDDLAPELLDRLRALVGADDTEATNALLTEDYETATELVDRYLGDFGFGNDDAAPQSIVTRAKLQVAADLFNRRNAQNGMVEVSFAGPEGQIPTPVPLGRDPIASARDLLRPWVLEVNIA